MYRLPPVGRKGTNPVDNLWTREHRPVDHDCPRCGATVTQDLYGPCDRCRADLRDRFAGQARDVAVDDYEPKMNVTPNAVALKD